MRQWEDMTITLKYLDGQVPHNIIANIAISRCLLVTCISSYREFLMLVQRFPTSGCDPNEGRGGSASGAAHKGRVIPCAMRSSAPTPGPPLLYSTPSSGWWQKKLLGTTVLVVLCSSILSFLPSQGLSAPIPMDTSSMSLSLLSLLTILLHAVHCLSTLYPIHLFPLPQIWGALCPSFLQGALLTFFLYGDGTFMLKSCHMLKFSWEIGRIVMF